MIKHMATLKDALLKAVGGLKPEQSFNIIFYYDGPKYEALSAGQLPATPKNKKLATKWLDDVSPAGQCDPMPALQGALKRQPQLVYFLSDGEFNNLRSYKEIEEEIARLNPGNRTRINTILFETFDKETEEVLQRIARNSGGTYRYVKEADVVE